MFATTPDRVWKQLFSAAEAGGAYNAGVAGAHGRLAAWRSMAALADAHLDASAGEVERRTRDCAWYGFETDVGWFQQVAWDVGVAAVGPDGRRLAILAATDTD